MKKRLISKVRKFFITLVFLGLISVKLAAQSNDTTLVIESTIENAVEAFDPESTLNAEELAEYLQLLAQQPININKAGIDELLKVPGLNFKMAQAIVAYRKIKPFETIKELSKIKGIGSAALRNVSPYVTVGSKGALQKTLLLSPGYWNQRGKLEHLTRLQRTLHEQSGYVGASGYQGDPYKVYHRTSYTTEHASLNLTLDKDAGETWNAPLGYDYTSFHVAIRDVGIVNQLILGDYSVAFGQGLTLWNGSSFGKGNDVINAVSRSERGLKPYRSSLESGFQRGVAISLGKTFETTLFVSSRNESASVVSANGDTVRFPSGSGLHRTQTELDRRYNTSVGMIGGRFRWIHDTGWIGVTGFQFNSEHFIQKGTSVYNLYDFEGKTFSVFGLDYTQFWRNISLTGEISRSQNGAFSMVQSVQWLMSDITEFSLGIRSYDKKYQNPFAAGFGESSGASNEFGIYMGLSHQISDDWSARLYFDQYSFPGPRFGVNQPSKGYDWLVYNEYKFSRQTQVSVLTRLETKEDDRDEVRNERTVSVLDPQTRWSVRTDLTHQLTPKLRLRFRLEHVGYTDFDQNDSGWLVYQDVRWAVARNLQIDARIAFFDTDSFDARIYQYENDVLYNFSNPVLNGQGQRSYMLMKYNPSKRVDIWLKYDISIFENVSTVGSGNDLIQGNSRSKVTFQVRYSF